MLAPKHSVRLFVDLVMRYVNDNRLDLALSSLQGGILPEEREQLLSRLADSPLPTAHAVIKALKENNRPG